MRKIIKNNLDQKGIADELFRIIDDIRKKTIDLTSNLNESELKFKNTEYSWSILEILQHLVKIETIFYLAIKNSLLPENKLETFVYTYRIDEFTRNFILNRNNKMKAPPVAEPKDKMSYNQIVSKLERSRQNVKKLVFSNLDKNLFAQASVYPITGEKAVNIFIWIDLLGIHDQKHYMQIKEILALIR
ncbi:DinB family protein [candidate division KSB1 bacterium]